jgi:hypothetical protein
MDNDAKSQFYLITVRVWFQEIITRNISRPSAFSLWELAFANEQSPRKFAIKKYKKSQIFPIIIHLSSKTPRLKILLPLLAPGIYHNGIELETQFWGFLSDEIFFSFYARIYSSQIHRYFLMAVSPPSNCASLRLPGPFFPTSFSFYHSHYFSALSLHYRDNHIIPSVYIDYLSPWPRALLSSGK